MFFVLATTESFHSISPKKIHFCFLSQISQRTSNCYMNRFRQIKTNYLRPKLLTASQQSSRSPRCAQFKLHAFVRALPWSWRWLDFVTCHFMCRMWIQRKQINTSRHSRVSLAFDWMKKLSYQSDSKSKVRKRDYIFNCTRAATQSLYTYSLDLFATIRFTSYTSLYCRVFAFEDRRSFWVPEVNWNEPRSARCTQFPAPQHMVDCVGESLIAYVANIDLRSSEFFRAHFVTSHGAFGAWCFRRWRVTQFTRDAMRCDDENCARIAILREFRSYYATKSEFYGDVCNSWTINKQSGMGKGHVQDGEIWCDAIPFIASDAFVY